MPSYHVTYRSPIGSSIKSSILRVTCTTDSTTTSRPFFCTRFCHHVNVSFAKLECATDCSKPISDCFFKLHIAKLIVKISNKKCMVFGRFEALRCCKRRRRGGRSRSKPWRSPPPQRAFQILALLPFWFPPSPPFSEHLPCLPSGSLLPLNYSEKLNFFQAKLRKREREGEKSESQRKQTQLKTI